MPPRYLRTAEELRHLLAGLDLVEPGITFTTNWRPITPETPLATPNRSAWPPWQQSRYEDTAHGRRRIGRLDQV